MTLEDFLESVERDNPSDSLPEVLRALWFDKKGDWDRAHQACLVESLKE